MLRVKTPDHPVSATRLTFPLVLVVSAIIGVASAWGMTTVQHAKLDDAVHDIAALQAQTLPTALEMQHVKDRLDNMERSLDRIEHAVGSK